MSKMHGKILVVDDDQAVLYTARLILKQQYTQVVTESSPARLLPLLQQDIYDVVVLDMNFAQGKTNGQEGLFWIKEIRKLVPKVQIIVTTAYGDIELAVQAMKEGAVDFLLKPWTQEKLTATVRAGFQLSCSGKEIEQLKHKQQLLLRELESPFAEIISCSSAMQPVFDAIRKVAATEANVLILGENGTGKELIAREIHRQSARRNEAFIKVDVGAIAETLFESELFGHVKGAFTGAAEDRIGRFEVASKGSLFLDEIGNLSLPLQAKLLTVLQNKQLIRVGANAAIDIDVRLICAANQPLYEMAASNKAFRQDLLYRINTVEIMLPALRDRKDDIPLLIQHFLQLFSKKYAKKTLSISKRALNSLQQYAWPGNVRELQHAVERAVIMQGDGMMEAADLLVNRHTQASVHPAGYNLEAMEKNAIAGVIKKHAGNLSQASRELGMGRSTLYRKLRKYGL